MKALRFLLIAILVVIAILLVVGFILPDTAHVERSIVIAAPQCTVFALTNGFARFNEWSPWAKIDPEASYSYSGPSHGVGARMEWKSDDANVGNGSQEITVSEPNSRVETALDFGPQGTAVSFFALAAEGNGTKVTWGFDTTFDNLMGRYFGLLMDSMLGPSYEQGLADLKALAEGLSQADWSDLDIETTETESKTIAFVSTSSGQESAEISQAHAEAYGQIGAFIKKNRLESTDSPLTVNTSWDENGFAFDAGIPIAAAPEEVADDSAVKIGATYGGKALKVVHTGSYAGLEATYEKIDAYVAAHGFTVTDRTWSEWVSDPGSVPEQELVTWIFYPIE